MVVQTAAVQDAARFDALVLMDTSHRAVRADTAIVDLGIAIARAEGMAAVLEAQDALADGGPLGTGAHERTLATRPGYREFGDRKMLASSPAMYAAMLQAITDHTEGLDRLTDLAGVRRPHPRHRRRGGPAVPEAVAPHGRGHPGRRLAVIPDAGHSPQFESPEAWWAALTGFLGRL